MKEWTEKTGGNNSKFKEFITEDKIEVIAELDLLENEIRFYRVKEGQNPIGDCFAIWTPEDIETGETLEELFDRIEDNNITI